MEIMDMETMEISKEVNEVNEIFLLTPDEAVNDYWGCCIHGGGMIPPW